MAAAARLMAGMSGRAVDGLEGGDEAGHLELRGGKRVGKVAESSEVAPSAQAVCQSSNADDSNIAPTANLGASACADSRFTRASGEQRAKSMRARDQVYPSGQPSFTDGWKWPRSDIQIEQLSDLLRIHPVLAFPPARRIRHVDKVTVRQSAARVRHEFACKAWVINCSQDAG